MGMSLVGILKQRHSPVRCWFEERLPNLKPLQAAWRGAGRPTIVCPNGVDRGTVGTAFDYRLRYLFGTTPVNRLVAGLGARSRGEWAPFADALDAAVERLRPIDRTLLSDEETELARYCWVLALFEARFRMKGRYPTPLDTLGPEAGLDALLGLAPPGGIEDLAALVSLLHGSELAKLAGRPCQLNPMFRRSSVIGDADADIVVDGMLLDVKTTRNHTMENRHDGYQLLGYLLLDEDDALHIDTVGFYLSRVPALLSWPVAELLPLVAGRPVDLGELRAEFASVRHGLDEPIAP